MIGLGTIINVAGILAGGLLGMLFGGLINEKMQQTLMKTMGFCTAVLGLAGTMEKMLVRLELDLYYLEHHNLWLDACILAQTFCRIVSGKRF